MNANSREMTVRSSSVLRPRLAVVTWLATAVALILGFERASYAAAVLPPCQGISESSDITQHAIVPANSDVRIPVKLRPPPGAGGCIDCAADAPSMLLDAFAVSIVDSDGLAVDGAVQGLGANEILWRPAAPLTPGETYVAEVTRNGMAVACVNQPAGVVATFEFGVSLESASDWLEGVTFRLTEVEEIVAPADVGCCEVRQDACASGEPCFQCWDSVAEPRFAVEWSGTGLAYLSLQSEAVSGSIVKRPPISDNVYALSAWGDYCVQGSVGLADEMPTRSFDSCGSASAVEPAEDLPERLRVDVDTCKTLPNGFHALSTLYVVQRATAEEAFAVAYGSPVASPDNSVGPSLGETSGEPESGSPPGSASERDEPIARDPGGWSCALDQRSTHRGLAWIIFAGVVGAVTMRRRAQL